MKRYGIGIYSDKEFNLKTPTNTEKTLKITIEGGAEIIPKGEYDVIIPTSNAIDQHHDNNLKEQSIIHIKEKRSATIKIETNLEKDAHHQQILIIAEPGSKADIIDIHNGKATLHTHRTEIIAKKNSRVNHTTIQETTCQQYTKKAANVEKGAKMTWNEIITSPKHIRTRTVTNLNGENAEVLQNTVYIAAEDQEFDVKARINHNAKNTRSHFKARGALNDKAKVILRGNIKINEGLTGCAGAQEQRTLLLSKDAQMNAVPDLEIENNNVECAHATSITQVDPKKVFYLMTRGYDASTAKQQITEGHIQPLLTETNLNVRERIKEQMRGKL